MSTTMPTPKDGEKRYYLNLILAGDRHREVIDSVGDEPAGQHDDYPVRQAGFISPILPRHRFSDHNIQSNTQEIFGRNLEGIGVSVTEGQRLRAVHPWQIGEIHTGTITNPESGRIEYRPFIRLNVAPVMFRLFWEAAVARNGERLHMTIISQKVGDRFAVTDVRLFEPPATHPVVGGTDFAGAALTVFAVAGLLAVFAGITPLAAEKPPSPILEITSLMVAGFGLVAAAVATAGVALRAELRRLRDWIAETVA